MKTPVKKPWLSARNFRHGFAKTRAYFAWTKMRNRCLDSNDKAYKNYGARGIRICARWINSVENFIADMGECPQGLSLDRINNDGDYEPSNCRWASRAVQNSNRRGLAHLTFNGVTKTKTQWSAELGIPTSTLNERMKWGWSLERALTEPIQTKFRRKEAR